MPVAVWRPAECWLSKIKTYPRYLEKALQKVVTLPPDEQDAIASQIPASLADEEDWKERFIEKRDVIRRMAREALDEDDKGETSIRCASVSATEPSRS